MISVATLNQEKEETKFIVELTREQIINLLSNKIYLRSPIIKYIGANVIDKNEYLFLLDCESSCFECGKSKNEVKLTVISSGVALCQSCLDKEKMGE